MSSSTPRPSLVPFDDATMTGGWVPGGPSPSVVISNMRVGVQVPHVMWLQADNTVMYDQILMAEKGGGVALAVDAVRGVVGLQLQWRPQTPNQAQWEAEWPDIDVTTLGRPSWEVARGFRAEGDQSGAVTAVAEAEEEYGFAVRYSEPLCSLVANTTFNPHLTACVLVTVDTDKLGRPHDPHEQFLSRLTWFGCDGLAKLILEGQLYCGFTLSAIGAYAMVHPGHIF